MLTRTDAAIFLTISTRQLDRLGLPRCKIGSRTIYQRSDLVEFVAANRIQAAAKFDSGRKPFVGAPKIGARGAANDKHRRAEMLKLLS